MPSAVGGGIRPVGVVRISGGAVCSTSKVDYADDRSTAVDVGGRQSGDPVFLRGSKRMSDEWLLHARMLGGVLSGSCVHRVNNL